MSAPNEESRIAWERAISAAISRLNPQPPTAGGNCTVVTPASVQLFSYKIDEAHEIGDVGIPAMTSFPTIIDIKYSGVSVSDGIILSPACVQMPPSVSYKHRADRWYSLVMTDPDVPSRAEPLFREHVHWVVINIPADRVEEGDVVLPYTGAAPSMNSGLHRYRIAQVPSMRLFSTLWCQVHIHALLPAMQVRCRQCARILFSALSPAVVSVVPCEQGEHSTGWSGTVPGRVGQVCG